MIQDLSGSGDFFHVAEEKCCLSRNEILRHDVTSKIF